MFVFRENGADSILDLGLLDSSEKVQVRDVLWASLVAQMVKNPPAVQETQVQSLHQEDPQEKGMATHSSILSCLLSACCISICKLPKNFRASDNHISLTDNS